MTERRPTAEDFEAARKEMSRDPREIFLAAEAKHQMYLRQERERAERRRRLLRRLLPFRR